MASTTRSIGLALIVSTLAFFLGSAWRDGGLTRFFQAPFGDFGLSREEQAKKWIKEHPEQAQALTGTPAKKIRNPFSKRPQSLRLSEAQKLSLNRVQASSLADPSDSSDGELEEIPRRLAPEGTFYMLEYVTAQTDHGVIGFEPGQKVKLLESHPDKGTVLVSDGKYQAEMQASQMTNDLDFASVAKYRDANSQQQVAAYQAEQRRAYEAANLKVDAEHSKSVSAINAKMVASSMVGTVHSPLNEDSRPASSYDRAYLGYGSPYGYRYSPYNRSSYYPYSNYYRSYNGYYNY